MARLRLDKLLTHQRIGSRRDVTEKIRAGFVQVNGVVQTDSSAKVDTEHDEITCNGVSVCYEMHRYYMLHKPSGVVSATKDNLHETVLSLFPEQEQDGLFPVGRLDVDTEGLLLVTDDGEFSHRVNSPRHHVEKEYFARVAGVLDADAAVRFASGMQLAGGEFFQPASLSVLREYATQQMTEVSVVVSEGQFHQVKKMVKAVGGQVCYLKRVRIGGLWLDDSLPKGALRKLTYMEMEKIWKKSDSSKRF